MKKNESDAFQSYIDDNFSFCEGLTMIFKQSLWPIIGMLFHPTYMLVNAKILGSIDKPAKCLVPDVSEEVKNSFDCISAKTYLAAFGVASSSMGIILLAVGVTFNLGLTNIVP